MYDFMTKLISHFFSVEDRKEVADFRNTFVYLTGVLVLESLIFAPAIDHPKTWISLIIAATTCWTLTAIGLTCCPIVVWWANRRLKEIQDAHLRERRWLNVSMGKPWPYVPPGDYEDSLGELKNGLIAELGEDISKGVWDKEGTFKGGQGAFTEENPRPNNYKTDHPF